MNFTKIPLWAVLSAQFGTSSSEMINIDTDDRELEDMNGTHLETSNMTQLREEVMEDEVGVESTCKALSVTVPSLFLMLVARGMLSGAKFCV